MKVITGVGDEQTTEATETSDGSQPLSIIHLCWPAPVGGLERVVQGLATWTVRAGHEVTVLALAGRGDGLLEFRRSLEPSGVRVIKITSASRRYLRERRLVRAVLEELDPDVVHTHGYRCDLLHGQLARRLGLPTVSTLHGSSRMGGLSHFFEWLQERALVRFDGVVVVSEALRQSLLASGVERERLHLIPNGWVPPEAYLDRELARRELNLPPRRTVIGWIGRLIPIKGCDIFLESLELLASESDDWTGVVIGDGPERASLEKQARSLGIANRVRFAGSVPEAARVVRAMDIFALSSRSEGTPMTILEVMGAGIPVVATAVGGVPDVVDPPRGGWLVPPEDPRQLARAILEAIDSRREREQRGRAARERTHRVYGPEAWVAQHLVVYRSLTQLRMRTR